MKTNSGRALSYFVSWLATGALLLACSGTRESTSMPDAGSREISTTAGEGGSWTIREEGWRQVQDVGLGEWAIDASGLKWSPTSLGARMVLRTSRVGRHESMREVGSATPTRTGSRMELDRGEGVREWLVPHPSGIEQGFDLATKPAGDGALTIELAVEGLVPHDDGEATIALSDEHGARRMTIRGLAAHDASGTPLTASMRAHGANVLVRVDDTDARYPVVIDPIYDAALLQTLSVPSTFGGSKAATTLSTDGTTMFLGHRSGNLEPVPLQKGVVTIYRNSSAGWTFFGALESGSEWSTGFGASVAVDGNLALVTAPEQQPQGGGTQGLVYTYVFDGTGWIQEQLFPIPYGGRILLRGSTAFFGVSGAYAGSSEQVGELRIHEHSASGWTVKQVINPPVAKAFGRFGKAIASDGTWLAAGSGHADWGSGGLSGRVYLYNLQGTDWALAQELPPPAPDPNSTSFSTALALSGNTLFVGAPEETVGANAEQGAFYVYTRPASSWVQTQRITLSNGAAKDHFGSSLAFDGTTLLVAEGYGGGPGTFPSAFVYRKVNGSWTLVRRIASSYRLGPALALSGDTAAVVIEPWSTPTYTGNDVVQIFGFGSTPKGSTCTSDGACETGHCAEGVCCEAACSGQCQSCTEPGSIGTCRTLSGQPKAPKASCPGAGETCGARCDGNSPDCTFAAATTSCGGCSGSSLPKCDGQGVCGSPAPCPNHFNCLMGSCKTKCVSEADCASGYYCKSSACVKKGAKGAGCSASSACASGFCVDGVCCDKQCEGQCESCAEPGAEGTCLTVKGNPRGERSQCAGHGGPCAGRCDGADAAVCAYPPQSVACGCIDETSMACNGAGECSPGNPCPGGFRCADATSCRTECSSPEDCSGDRVCAAGHCVPRLHWTCSEDRSESISDVEDAPSIPCTPYVCGPEGICLQRCRTEQACAPGYHCDLDTYGEGVCLTPPKADAGSAACTVAPQRREAGVGAVFISLLGLLAARRRRPVFLVDGF